GERDKVLALRAAEQALAQARAAQSELAGCAAATETRLAAVCETIEKLGAERAELAEQSTEVERALVLLPNPALARTALEAARAQAAAARRRDGAARTQLERLDREAEARQQR